MSAVLRRATAADTQALLDLWAVARTAHAVTDDSAEAVERVLARSAVFVTDAAAADGAASTHPTLDGAVIAGWDGWRGTLYRLAVRPEARRRGLGGELVRVAERWLQDQGAERIAALVAFEDVDARAFWEALGFHADEVVGRMLHPL